MNQEHDWQEERRRNDTIMLGVMQQIRDDLKSMDNKLTTHIADEERQFVTAFARGFPEGDPEGHRKAHEAHIKQAIDRAEFWKKMAFEITRYGIFGFLGWAAYQLWVAFLHGPKT